MARLNISTRHQEQQEVIGSNRKSQQYTPQPLTMVTVVRVLVSVVEIVLKMSFSESYGWWLGSKYRET